MILYKVGCNFDYELIYGLTELNKIDPKVKVNELYGSDRQHAYLTARPDFRLVDIDMNSFGKYVKCCRDAGIRFNYTMNTIYPGSKRELNSRWNEIKDFVKYLESLGVEIVTVSNPLLAVLVREASCTIQIEVSTVAHIDTVSQIAVWKDKFNVSKVCGNLLKNRSIKFLRNAATWCNKNDIVYDLMVNEFCGNAGILGKNTYGTHCIYRDSCYQCHAENISLEDAQLIYNYPYDYCISSRNSDFSSWLKMRFIRPEDIEKYEGIGINNFKITGRTGGTEYILKVVEGYIRKSWNGNLLSLWKQLETIYSNENELEFKQTTLIDNKKLNGFIDYWFDNLNHECADEICGATCSYCNDFYYSKTRIL